MDDTQPHQSSVETAMIYYSIPTRMAKLKGRSQPLWKIVSMYSQTQAHGSSAPRDACTLYTKRPAQERIEALLRMAKNWIYYIRMHMLNVRDIAI